MNKLSSGHTPSSGKPNFYYPVAKTGKAEKFTSETSALMCLPQKIRGIEYNEPGSVVEEQETKAEEEEIQETSLKRGRMWHCPEEACSATFMYLRNLELHRRTGG